MPRLIPTRLPESVSNDPLRDSERAVYEAFKSHAPDEACKASVHVWIQGKETQPIERSFIDWIVFCGQSKAEALMAADNK